MGKINPIRVYCIAEEFDFNRLSQYLSGKTNSTVIKDTILYTPSTGGTALFFKSGVLVFWDVDFDTQKYILESIKDYLVGHYNKPITEDFSYMVESSQTGFKISRDIIYLNEETDLIKIAVSYPLAQSTKLYRFEESISDIIKR
ncbi:MAG: RMD1 family protein, partial [Deferribacterales bacterium]